MVNFLKELFTVLMGVVLGVGAWLLLALVLGKLFPAYGGYIVFACMLLAGATLAMAGATRSQLKRGKSKGS